MNFMPHGYCIAWEPTILWPWVVGNLLIAMAYLALPVMIYKIARRRSDLKPSVGNVFWLGAMFILLCGVGHVINTINFWQGWYQIESIWALGTGLISMTTTGVLWFRLDTILNLPSRAELDHNYKMIKEHLEEYERLKALYQEDSYQALHNKILTQLESWKNPQESLSE